MTKPVTDVTSQPAEAPLESWKAIAAYLQREVRTVRRWEHTEGLPVHRHQHLARSTVYAYPSELEAWRTSRRADRRSPDEPGPADRRPRRWLAVAAALGLTCLSAGGGRFAGPVEAAQSGRQLSSERLWSGPDANVEGRVSRDGRYLSFADWSEGPGQLAVRDLETGTNRRLTNDATDEDFAEESIFSPGGTRIAFHWGDKHPSIQVIDADGSNRRVLRRDRHEHHLWAWSPDERFLAVGRQNPDRTHTIALMSVEDGSTIPLITTGTRSPAVAGFSADGRFLAYSLPQGDAGEPGGLYTVAVDGSRRATLVEGPADYSSPLWTPDGSLLVFRSDRSSRMALWGVKVSDGQADGGPALLHEDELGSLIGIAGDGSLFFGRRTLESDAYLADFDPDTLTMSEPTAVSDVVVGMNRAPEISPDGRSVSFVRLKTGGRDVIVRNLATGEERTVASLVGGGYGARGPIWFPDGRALLVLDKTDRRTRIQRIDLETGEPSVLFEGPYAIWTLVALSPDGETLYYSIKNRDGVEPPEDGTLSLRARRLGTGDETVLYERASPGAGIFGIAVSPDGGEVAFLVNIGTERALLVVPSRGGRVRELQRLPFDQAVQPGGGMAWTPDRRHLIVTGRSSDGRGERLFALPVNGGPLVPLGRGMQDVSTRMLSADGRRLAFTGTTRADTELWVVRHLLDTRPGR